jgi:hydrogenase maturation factor
MVCGMSSTRVGVYIEGLRMKFVIFCNFFRIFWTPNGQKRLVATASTRGADVASRTNRKPEREMCLWTISKYFGD